MNESNYKGTGQGTNASGLAKMGRLFYIINPYDHNYGLVKEVPDYVVDVSMHVKYETRSRCFIFYRLDQNILIEVE